MSTLRVASRYAEAILDAVPDGMDINALVQDLQDLKASVEASRELKLFFTSPIIAKAQKSGALKELFQGRLSAYTISVLLLLVEKNREAFILDIIAQALEMQRTRDGIISTSVHSAVEMNEQQRTQLVAALEAASGKRVEAEYAIEPELMAGLVVRLGDTVYDGSVQHQLQRLRRRFVSGR